MSDTTPRPTSNDKDAWKAYWTEQGEPWRTEPEICPERQHELANRRDTIKPDIEKGIYPFRNVRLSRADIEWLLHELGPIDWSDKKQRKKEGLDLRGALLNYVIEGEIVDLSKLPLARTKFGLASVFLGIPDEREQAASHLGMVNFSWAHLEGASFRAAYLQNADFRGAYLEEADFLYAHLEGASFVSTHLTNIDFSYAHLEMAFFNGAYLENAYLSEIHLEGAYFNDTHLEGANLQKSHLEGANFISAHLEGADLSQAHLAGAYFLQAHLESAFLGEALLEGKILSEQDYQRINAATKVDELIIPRQLPAADLRLAFFNEATSLNDIILGDNRETAYLADIRWGGVNLAVIPWTTQHISILGDEVKARKTFTDEGKPKNRTDSLREWEAAVRAYRQLAVALRDQGMNEVADRFAYRAQRCQRRLLRMRRKGGYLWSGFLDVLAGYGYAPERTLFIYILVISAYALAFFFLGQSETHHLSPLGSVVFSITSFHGRGFFPGGLTLDDPLTVIAATEAIIGLLIEVSFIATFTQRFFSR